MDGELGYEEFQVFASVLRASLDIYLSKYISGTDRSDVWENTLAITDQQGSCIYRFRLPMYR